MAQTELPTVTFRLKPIEIHNLRILAAHENKQLGPFVGDFLRESFDLKRDIPELNQGPHAPGGVAGTTSLTQTE